MLGGERVDLGPEPRVGPADAGGEEADEGVLRGGELREAHAAEEGLGRGDGGPQPRVARDERAVGGGVAGGHLVEHIMRVGEAARAEVPAHDGVGEARVR